MRPLDPDRRRFLRLMFRGVAAAAAAGFVGPDPRNWFASSGGALAAGDDLQRLVAAAPVARFWIPAINTEGRPAADCVACHSGDEVARAPDFAHADRPVRCLLCAHRCLLQEGERGLCRARINDGGVLRSLVYGRPIAVHADPIEKKPFYHFLPGSLAFSLATSGCPLRCKFCQNWEISQARPEDYATEIVTPAAIGRAARDRGAPIIAFTYNEPTVFFEYMADIAETAREEGLRCVLISCGFMEPEPLAEMCGFLDAVKIDLKGITPSFYRDVCQAELAPVLRSIQKVARSDTHLELVNLVVPTLNDREERLAELARWVAGEIGPDTPVHFTRFHPDYQLRHLPGTPVATLERARALAQEAGLHYPYVGNVPGHPGNQTYCPGCGEVVVSRKGFFIEAINLDGGRCTTCREPIAGVWS